MKSCSLIDMAVHCSSRKDMHMVSTLNVTLSFCSQLGFHTANRQKVREWAQEAGKEEEVEVLIKHNLVSLHASSPSTLKL